tara:strand:- start:593 stop:1939 length:1347 start_codon:yes stop_codon:yes gene_type:complete
MVQHKKVEYFILLIISIVLFSCSKKSDAFINPVLENESNSEVENKKPNILLVIADDMGLDATPGYNIGHEKPSMPTLESMMNNGVKFTNVWSNPTCTPSRATLLTGKYGFRTNVVKVDDVLSTSETSIQKYINQNLDYEYSNAVIGKWHLSKDNNHPNLMGIDYYAGSLTGSLKDYNSWSLNINGETSTSTAYNTTKYTDLAINWVKDQTKPWFLWLAYSAPHEPFHLPPTYLHLQGDLPTDEASINANPLPYYLAMLEAMDTEFGRLLDSMSSEEKENTVIIFIGDNGTPNEVAQEYNSRRVKGSLYQGGINIPMVISGKNITRLNDTEDALVNVTDLFATIANIAGVNVSTINDSYSFNELLSTLAEGKRAYIYSEIEGNSSLLSKTIRNKTHKYMLFEDGSESLFNLNEEPLETKDLLRANNLPLSESDRKIKDELANKLVEINP